MTGTAQTEPCISFAQIVDAIAEDARRKHQQNIRRRIVIRNGAKSPGLALLRMVMDETGLTKAEIIGPNRLRKFVQGRWLYSKLAVSILGHTLEKVGSVLGGRDHTTIMHGLREFDALYEKDGNVRRSYDSLVIQLGGAK